MLPLTWEKNIWICVGSVFVPCISHFASTSTVPVMADVRDLLFWSYIDAHNTTAYIFIQRNCAWNGFRVVNIATCKTCVIILAAAVHRNTFQLTIWMSWIISFWCWISKLFLCFAHVGIFRIFQAYKWKWRIFFFWLYIVFVVVVIIFSFFSFFSKMLKIGEIQKKLKSTKDETACVREVILIFSVFWFGLFCLVVALDVRKKIILEL